jgi:hypothetical protein
MIAQYIFFLVVITNVAVGTSLQVSSFRPTTYPACGDPSDSFMSSYCDTSTRMVVVCQSPTQPGNFKTYQQDCLLNTEYEETCIDKVASDEVTPFAHCVANYYYRNFPSNQEPNAYCSHDDGFDTDDSNILAVGMDTYGYDGKPFQVPQLGIKLNGEWIVLVPNAHNASFLISNYVSGTKVQFCFDPGNNQNVEAYGSGYSYQKS